MFVMQQITVEERIQSSVEGRIVTVVNVSLGAQQIRGTLTGCSPESGQTMRSKPASR